MPRYALWTQPGDDIPLGLTTPVVRQIPPNKFDVKCKRCRLMLNRHGRMTQDGVTVQVCPGDVIESTGSGYRVVDFKMENART